MTSALEHDRSIETASGNSQADDEFSQATVRMYRIFTDQWGREWGANCEKKTQHPCGPYAARFRAPLMPSAKYIVIVDTIRAKVVIDTRRWIQDLIDLHNAYWEEVEVHAREIAGVRAPTLYSIENGTVEPQVARLVGKRPMPIEVIQAMRAGNPWILGLRKPDGTEYAKPAAAPRDFFPDAEQLLASDPLREYDPWADAEQYEGPPPETDTSEPTSYPHHYGGGWWWLSNDHRLDFVADKRPGFQGSKIEAQRAALSGQIPVARVEEAPKAIHPSWTDDKE